MGLSLNTLQRAVLLGAALAISVVLWIQIDEEGLSETPWLWGMLVILSLLVAASVGVQFPAKVSSTTPPPPSFHSSDTPKAVLKTDFLAIVDRMGDFIRAKLKTLPHNVDVQFLGETGGYVDGVALKAAFMLALLKREKKRRGYIETNEVMELRMLAVGHLANSKMQDLRRETSDSPVKRADMLKLSGEETVKCELAVRKTLHNMALAAELPFDPIFKLLDQELPLADGDAADRDKTYGPITRSIITD